MKIQSTVIHDYGNWPVSHKHFVYLLCTLVAIYLIISRGLFYSSEVEMAVHISCNNTNPRDSYSAAASINSTPSLWDIDRLVKRNINSPACSMPPPSTKKPKVIIILPYRNRQLDLLAFLLHMIPYGRRRQINIEVLVAEQTSRKPFNRAKLFNAAVREIDLAAKAGGNNRLAGSSCFALHDVDKLPESPDVPYHCESGPHQLLRVCKYRKGTLGWVFAYDLACRIILIFG